MKNFLALAFIISVSLRCVSGAFAQGPGTLDPTFANNGELGDSAINAFKYSSLAISPGNEIVVSSAVGNAIRVIRYTYAGLRDINFGQNAAGSVQIVNPGFSGSVTASIVQTDCKILIAGQYALTSATKQAYLLRLNVSGTVDSSFGANGWVYFNYLPHYGECIRQIALQNDGKIVALDMGINPGLTDTVIVARLNTNGTNDNTFAANGHYEVPFNNFLATSPVFFKLGANDNFTFAGYSNYQAGDYIYLFRLNPAGIIDITFGKAGSILIDSTNIINGGTNLGFCFQNNGKLLTVQSKQTGSTLWAACRYNVDGSIDQNFGTNGMVNIQPNLDPLPYFVQNIAVTSTDEIIVAGVINEAGSNRTIVCSMNPDGGTNLSFGNNAGSELMNSFEWDDIVYNLLIAPNDEIVVNGLVNETNGAYNVFKLLPPTPTTAIKNLTCNIDFLPYPDPAGTEVNFKLSGEGTGYITVNDITGNLVFVQQANSNTVQTLNIGNLASGIYIVTYRDGESVVSKKMVKQ